MMLAYLGGCWMTNIGNAFIDTGALHLCRMLDECAFYSELSPFLMGPNGTAERINYLFTMPDIKPKAVLFSGMVTCTDFIADQSIQLKAIKKHNIPIIFNGVGGAAFTSGEVKAFRAFIKEHNCVGFISRDDESYDAYHDLFPQSYRGVDCAFFMPDASEYKFLKKLPKKYTVFNIEEEFGPPRPWDEIPEYVEAEKDHSDVHAIHQMIDTELKANPALGDWRRRKNTLMCEIPQEYIYLYGLAKTTFTSRVHAAIATIAFGGKALLMHPTPRAKLFSRVCSGDVRDKPTAANQDMLAENKAKHLDALRKIVSSL